MPQERSILKDLYGACHKVDTMLKECPARRAVLVEAMASVEAMISLLAILLGSFEMFFSRVVMPEPGFPDIQNIPHPLCSHGLNPRS